MLWCAALIDIERRVEMNYKETYELLLQTLCESYRKMLKLLDQLECFDELLAEISSKHRPDTRKLCAITTQQERLIQNLDQLSILIEQLHERLDPMSELCHEVFVHPMYQHMEDLQLLSYYRIRTVINKEDINNPDIIVRLSNYRESLELDAQIEEVPMSERQVFMFVPDRKN